MKAFIIRLIGYSIALGGAALYVVLWLVHTYELAPGAALVLGIIGGSVGAYPAALLAMYLTDKEDRL